MLTVRQAGKKGGKKAARNMTPEQRRARAKIAALARWAKVKAEQPQEKAV